MQLLQLLDDVQVALDSSNDQGVILWVDRRALRLLLLFGVSNILLDT